MAVNKTASREALPIFSNLATDVMGASQSRNVLRMASSGSPILLLSTTVIGAMITLTASPAMAQSAPERTTGGGRVVQPQVFDFSVKNRQKSEAKQLLQDAREAVAQGHIQKARGLLRQAAELPLNGDLGEKSPQRLLRELDALPSDDETRRPTRSLADIPTISQLAEPNPEDEAPHEPARNSLKRGSQRTSADNHASEAPPTKWASESSSRSAPRGSEITGSTDDESQSVTTVESRPGAEQVNANQRPEYIVLQAASATPLATGRDASATASVGPVTKLADSNSDQTLVHFSTVLLSALFGAVLVLVGVLLFFLKKFGPNPTFVFKVEMTNTGRDVEPAARPSPPTLQIAPVYAMKMQMEEEREKQQEEAVMQKVFEDNLELREKLAATSQAA